MASWSNWINIEEGYKRYSKIIYYADGTWTGPSLSTGSWVGLSTNSTNGRFTYYHNLNLDLDKVVSASVTVFDSASTTSKSKSQGLRCGSSGSTGYRYFTTIHLAGDATQTYSNAFGGLTHGSSSDFICAVYRDDDYPGQSSSSKYCTFTMYIYSNRVEFSFTNGGKNFYQMMGYPVFVFNMVYQ